MPEPLSEAVRRRGRNLGQVQGVRAGSGDAAVVDVDQDQVVRFLANRSIETSQDATRSTHSPLSPLMHVYVVHTNIHSAG